MPPAITPAMQARADRIASRPMPQPDFVTFVDPSCDVVEFDGRAIKLAIGALLALGVVLTLLFAFGWP